MMVVMVLRHTISPQIFIQLIFFVFIFYTSLTETAQAVSVAEQALFLKKVEEGDVAAVKRLIGKGADVNAKDKGGGTSLHSASQEGHVAVAELLIGKGADVNAKNKDDWTPLHSALVGGHVAVAELLIGKGADVNAKGKNDWTPLHFASVGGHVAVAKLLIGKGADVNAEDKDGWTPLYSASVGGHVAEVKFLIGKGSDVNAKTNGGGTPLHSALQEGHVAVAELLIGKGADVNAKDKGGGTPLDFAKKDGGMAKLLRRAGGQKGGEIVSRRHYADGAIAHGKEDWQTCKSEYAKGLSTPDHVAMSSSDWFKLAYCQDKLGDNRMDVIDKYKRCNCAEGYYNAGLICLRLESWSAALEMAKKVKTMGDAESAMILRDKAVALKISKTQSGMTGK